MSEKRFRTSEEIAVLRNKGVVAVSPYVCRLSASITILFFLYNQQIFEQLRTLLSVSALVPEGFIKELLSLIRTLVIASSLYLFTFAATAFLQSRFYFSVGQVFTRNDPIFDLSRALSLLKLSAILFVVAILGFCGIVCFLWKEFLFAAFGLIRSASLPQVFSVVEAYSKKLSFIIAGVLLVSIVLVLLFSKLSFNFRNRVSIRSR